MSESKLVAKNTAIQIFGKGISTALGIAVIALVTRSLLPVGFGQYTNVITFVSFFGIVADLGLTLITAQMISEKGADEEKILGSILSFRIISAFIVFALAPIVALATPYPTVVKWGIAVAAWSFFFVSITQTMVGVFQKHLAMHFPMIAETIGRLVLLAFTLYAVFAQKNVVWFLVAVVFGNIANFLVVQYFARRFVSLRLRWDSIVIKEMWKRSIPIAVSIVFNLVYLKADMLILSFVRPEADVGIYGAAYRVIDILMMVPVMLMGLVLPIATRSWSEGDSARVRRVIQKTFDAFIVYSVPILVGGYFLADDVMALVAGPEFRISGTPLRILLVAFFCATISTLFGHFIVALGKQRKVVWVYASDAVVSLIAYLSFIPLFGITAAAWSTVGSEFYAAVVLGFVVYKTVSLSLQMRVVWRVLCAVACMCGALIFLASAELSVVGAILIAAAIYVGVLGLLKTHKIFV